MSSRRSAGVTVVALVVILSKGAAGAGAGLTLIASSAIVEQQLAAVRAASRDRPADDGDPHSQMQREVERLTEAMRAFYRSPAIRLNLFVGGTLGMVGLAAGVGILLLKGWARTLLLWQAGASIVFLLGVIWLILPAYQQTLVNTMTQVVGDPTLGPEVPRPSAAARPCHRG